MAFSIIKSLMLLRLLTLLSVAITIISCGSDEIDPTLFPEENEELSGGLTTIFDESPNAFGLQAPNLSSDEGLLFFVGNSFFNQNWVTSPSSTTARDGLGPYFNARACSSCHFKDGRGRPPEFSGELNTGLLLRLGSNTLDAHGGSSADINYGGQLQDQSILGIMEEGGFEILYSEVTGEYEDGTKYSLRKPLYKLLGLNYGDLSADTQISPRVAQQMIGLGLLEAVSEQDIVAMADENDSNNDGISGKPNYVWNVEKQSKTIGRFGWKANQPTVLQQSAGALNGDIGITSRLFPDENCVKGCDDLANGGEPEIDDDDLDKIALYSSTLAVPARRNWDDQQVLKGKKVFNEIGCQNCHIPKLTTGQHPSIEALSNQEIRPYTDLLLHDMGEGLADNRPDFEANGKEWRTAPLWGIGLVNIVNSHTFFLHDGRARNLEEAILWHDGEGKSAKDAFLALELSNRQHLITFLESL
ncbi:di-heme oxidoredictase family protein [Reichenbachiella sp. MALMAid0571]|uniref:di-heme oxidoreductase family protein n=1 Tax=Reichenbachiella sp. MALMAid0571 TaxID=3143939 RepID=UPI0032DEC66B